MAKPKHRKFNTDKFVDVFAEHLHWLRDFAHYFDNTRFSDEEDFDLDAFKELAAEAVTHDPNMVEQLYRAYDMSKHLSRNRGHPSTFRSKHLVLNLGTLPTTRPA